MIQRRKSTWLVVLIFILLCLGASGCNGTPTPTGECHGSLYVTHADVARVAPSPKEDYSVGDTYSWSELPYGIEVTGARGEADLRIYSAANTLLARYTIHAADRANGSVSINKWNGLSEITFNAGNFIVEDHGSQEICNLSLFAGGVDLTSLGTTYLITVRPEIDEVKVAILEGSVDLTSQGETVTLDASVPYASLAVITDGDIGSLQPIPDPGGVLEEVSNGGDIVLPEPAVTRTPTLTPTLIPSLTPTRTPTPTLPPAQYDLAFASDVNGDFNIFLMDTQDHSSWIDLALPVGYERAWWPSFCGSYIAGEVIDRDGGSPQWIYLADPETDWTSFWEPEASGSRLGVPRCSPDGEYLAYSASSGTQWNLFSARFDGSAAILIDAEGYTGYASWLSDNSRLYSMAGGSVTPFIIRYVTNVRQSSDLNIVTVTSGKYPAVSPDGSLVAYICGDELSLCLWDVSNASISILHPITYVRLDGLPVPASPAWSVDGEWIYFPSAEDGDWDIYRIRPDGSELENITPDWPSNELMPALQW
jgi:Tol biopolymer transport system component